MKQSVSKQVTAKEEKTKDRREERGRIIALSRRIYRLQNKDVYYVESETSSESRFYFVRFNSSFAAGSAVAKITSRTVQKDANISMLSSTR